LLSGDIIVTFDGTEIPTSASLPHVVGLVTPGSVVEVEIVRNKDQLTKKVKVGGLDADESYSLAAGKTEGGQGGRLGMDVEELPAESLERFGINGGVVVRKVDPGSVSAEAGVRVGDVITLIDTTPIKSTKAFERAVDALKDGSSVPLRLIRQGSPLFIGLKVPD
jgi:serine protease Do